MTDSILRRDFLRRLAAVGIGTGVARGGFSNIAAAMAQATAPRRHCILLWMSGGPSQTDTFDMKPNHENGGEFKEIQTAVPGLRFSEHLPKLASMADRLAIVRGMSTKEGDHGRGTYLMRTGYKPMGPEQYPSIGASLSSQLDRGDVGLPKNVSIGTYRALNQDAFGPGFLGPRFSPLFVGATDYSNAPANDESGFPELQVQSLKRASGISEQRMEQRLKFWQNLQAEFVASRQQGAAGAHHEIYQGALRLMNSEDARAFNLSEEPTSVREQYGATLFGQGCLLARRLVERGVPFVEVSLGTSSSGVGWDTHANNFSAVRELSIALDNGWGTLMRELDERELLDTTTILWMGEFGRTPVINASVGRDHFPNAWSTVLAGGGIAGGQVYGKTSDDGTTVVDGQVGVADLLATLCGAVGIGSHASNLAPSGRPIPIADGDPIKELLS